MLLMYLIALIPIIVGGVLWINKKEISIIEWVISAGIAFLTSGLFHLCVVAGMTVDEEIWSGSVLEAIHIPKWRAEWTEVVTRTDSDGNVSTSTVTRSRNHDPRWYVITNIGEFDISNDDYDLLKSRFGSELSRPGHRPDYDSGDLNDYYLVNDNNWLQPVHDSRVWYNKVKASPSVFSFPPVPDGIGVYEYPEVDNIFRSSRLFGRASIIDILEFDKMCSRLGPVKKVNIIIIGFPEDSDQSIAHYQESKWIGGKKNDLVICYGGSGQSRWSYVFGWTEEELVKRNLETIILNNDVNTNILKLIENEIMNNYVIKDWSKFDYLSIEPPTYSYFLLICVMLVSQTVLWIIFHRNELRK